MLFTNYREDFDTRLQSITSQLINDPLATSTSSNLTHTSTVVSGTSTTVANTTTITSNPTPTVSASTNYAQEELGNYHVYSYCFGFEFGINTT